MTAYRIETVVAENGAITLNNLPLKAGETVEVIILVQSRGTKPADRYPLHGAPIHYIAPTEPVADDDWECCR